MIERYTRAEMGAIWTDEARMEAWRQVEVAAAEALEEGPTPEELAAIRAATFTVAAVQERERVTDHDMAAFVDVLAESAGPAGRWIHFGLTSSDVLDTALALQLRSAGELLVPAAREVTHRFQVLSTFLREVLGVDAVTAESEACLIEHDISPGTTSRFVDFLKLLHEDPELAQLLRKRYSEFRRSCAPSDACSTCGLGCLVPEPR